MHTCAVFVHVRQSQETTGTWKELPRFQPPLKVDNFSYLSLRTEMLAISRSQPQKNYRFPYFSTNDDMKNFCSSWNINKPSISHNKPSLKFDEAQTIYHVRFFNNCNKINEIMKEGMCVERMKDKWKTKRNCYPTFWCFSSGRKNSDTLSEI